MNRTTRFAALPVILNVRHETTMLPQEQMIEAVRRLCAGDDAIVAALKYGSFVRGGGDEFSDVEFYSPDA